MSNPFEFREAMKAAMHYGETRSVQEVLAAQEARHNERRTTGKGKSTPSTPSPAPVPALEMDKLRALLANAPPRSRPAEEVASEPDGH